MEQPGGEGDDLTLPRGNNGKYDQGINELAFNLQYSLAYGVERLTKRKQACCHVATKALEDEET